MPYRFPTLFFLACFFATLWIPPTQSVPEPRRPLPDGVFSIDPCDMLEQLPFSTKLAGLGVIAGFVTVAAFGIMNRRAPRWASLGFATTWFWMLERQSWRIEHCWAHSDWLAAALQTAVVLLWASLHLFARKPN